MRSLPAAECYRIDDPFLELLSTNLLSHITKMDHPPMAFQSGMHLLYQN